MEGMKKEFKILLRKREYNSPYARRRHRLRLEDNIKMGLKNEM
jgi:hypothetical protein